MPFRFFPMKRLIFTIAVLFAYISAGWAAAPATLTTLQAIHALTNAEAAKKLPVAFEATVTYYNKARNTLFVYDDGVGAYVSPKTDAALVPGDHVLVKGKTNGSFHPVVESESVTFLRHGERPKPIPAAFDELNHMQYDCLPVTARGVIRSFDPQMDTDRYTDNVQVLMDGGYITARIQGDTTGSLENLLDAEVEVTGVAGGIFDGKMQPHGVAINVFSLADLKIVKRASVNPWSLPLTPMDQVMAGHHVTDRTQRVRVHGTITYNQPGVAVVLQDGSKSLWISTQTMVPMKLGDLVNATGFPESHNGFLALINGEIQDTDIQAPVEPMPSTRIKLAESNHILDLVSVEGVVESEARDATQDEYHLLAEDQFFTAVIRHPSSSAALSPLKQVPLGAKVRVAGICITLDANPFNGQVPFDILMRTPNDIVMIAPPSGLNTRSLMLIVGLLLLVVFAAIARGWALEHKMRRQTAVLSARTEAEAELERQRSRILEDINGSRPLAEILEGIATMVSSTLEGAPCWCEVADGAKLGSYPQDPQGLRIVREEIPARSGPALGTLYAGLDPRTPPLAREIAALQNGVRLATLAIETRRLYSDLRRRSEFDLLTDIRNRFAMEKFIESQIDEARQSGRILGLIYIDLDKFKPINDTYGHHVGDLYLQAVAARMSRQLLGGDMLARLGGDEFAALVALHHGRSDLDTIVARLEHCFDDPYVVGGYTLHGEASIGVAIYPEDGATTDSLLSAADAAMYEAKHSKRQAEENQA
jgi:diguanylate cyclase (GGDEF)-like protein